MKISDIAKEVAASMSVSKLADKGEEAYDPVDVALEALLE